MNIPWSSKRVIAILCLFLAITGAVTVRRALKGSNDFDTYYNAGRAVLQGGSHIYYKGEGYIDNAEEGPFLYPPFAACFFALFSWLPLALAAFFWNAASVLFFLSALYLLYRFIRGKEAAALPWNSLKNRLFESILCLIFAVVVLIDNLSMAQVNIFVFFLIAAALAAWQKNKHSVSGMLISAAVLIKVMPAVFLIYFLVKRQWRVLGGAAAGFLLLTLLIPSCVFGIENNRLLVRQWLGRTVKPLLVEHVGEWNKEIAGPFRTHAEKIRHDNLAGALTQKNQSLSAAVTRLSLRGRNQYAYHPEHPVYPGQKYSRLPVLFGGLSLKGVNLLVKGLQVFTLLFLIFAWARTGKREDANMKNIELSLAFVSMTMLAPWARSHQFVVWIFPLLTYLFWRSGYSAEQAVNLPRKVLKAGIYLFFFLYILQAIPYGKPAGLGAWANLVLWISFSVSLVLSRRDQGRQTE